MATYDIEKATYGSNTYVFNDKIVRAAVTTLIDTGSKNLIGGSTYGPSDKDDKNVRVDIPVNLSPGVYTFYAGVIQSGAGGGSPASCLVRTLSGGSVVGTDTFITSGTNSTCTIETEEAVDTIRVYAASTPGGSTGYRIWISRPMLCYKTLFDLTSRYAAKLMTLEEIQRRLAGLMDWSTKNYLNYANATTQEISGVTWTVNSNGTITANGQATANSTLYIWRNATPPPPLPSVINISGIPEGGSSTTFGIQFVTSNLTKDIYTTNETFAVTGTPTRLALRVFSGYNAQNLIFSPMVCSAEDYDLSPTFQPYRPSYQELYDMVKALQT